MVKVALLLLLIFVICLLIYSVVTRWPRTHESVRDRLWRIKHETDLGNIEEMIEEYEAKPDTDENQSVLRALRTRQGKLIHEEQERERWTG